MASFPSYFQALFFYRSFKVNREHTLQFRSKYAAAVDTLLFIVYSLPLLLCHAVVTLGGYLFGC